MHVLHIADKFETGVAAAIETYIKVTPNFSHSLLSRTIGNYNSQALDSLFSSHWHTLEKNPVKAILEIHRTVKAINPDVIHFHSSMAGFYGRLACSRKHNTIYTPHCYSFERDPDFLFSRQLYWLAELIASKIANGCTIAACSIREQKLAQKFSKQVSFIPNCSFIKPPQYPTQKQTPIHVCMIGRITQQKDPQFFLDTYKLVKSKNIKFIWIGDGKTDSAIKKEMEKQGISVTGMITPKEVYEILNKSMIYFHTALWEGFPISIIEAANLQKKMVIRSAPYLEGINLAKTVSTPTEAAREILFHLEHSADMSLENEKIRTIYNCENLRSNINQLYLDKKG